MACSVENCEAKSLCKGLCLRHYQMNYRRGSTEAIYGTGDSVGYRAVHYRLVKAYGRASEHLCPCGKQAQEYAYLHSDANEKVDPRGRPFTTDLAHYEARCIPCHRAYDSRKDVAA